MLLKYNPETANAVVVYHKNASKLYKPHWIQKCLDSIYYQTCQDFDVLELCYGDEDEDLTLHYSSAHKLREQGRWWRLHEPMENHVYAMNTLIHHAFSFNHYDVVFNVNLDDFYEIHRFEEQLQFIPEYDIVSSNLVYIEEKDGQDIRCQGQPIVLSDTNVDERLRIDWNVIAHPCVCMTRNFWDKYGPYDVNAIPREDLNLWKKANQNGAKFKIIDKNLLFYRIHNNQICATK
jgi:hypothetical protein